MQERQQQQQQKREMEMKRKRAAATAGAPAVVGGQNADVKWASGPARSSEEDGYGAPYGWAPPPLDSWQGPSPWELMAGKSIRKAGGPTPEVGPGSGSGFGRGHGRDSRSGPQQAWGEEGTWREETSPGRARYWAKDKRQYLSDRRQGREESPSAEGRDGAGGPESGETVAMGPAGDSRGSRGNAAYHNTAGTSESEGQAWRSTYSSTGTSNGASFGASGADKDRHRDRDRESRPKSAPLRRRRPSPEAKTRLDPAASASMRNRDAARDEERRRVATHDEQQQRRRQTQTQQKQQKQSQRSLFGNSGGRDSNRIDIDAGEFISCFA